MGDWRLVPVSFTGDGRSDLVVFRPSDGAFAKWYNGNGGFIYQPLRFIGGKPGTWSDAQLIPIDFDGNGKVDVMAFRRSDGAFAKWYTDPNDNVGPDFDYQAVRHIGGKPGAWSDAQLIPIDFDGNGKMDILAFRPSDGAFAKWYSDPNGKVGPDFDYQAVRHIGGKPGAWSDAQLIPIDFDGNGKMDILAFRPSDGAFAKWYSDPNGKVGPDFNYQAVQFIGGKPGAWTGAQLIPIDFDGNGKVDILVFRPSDGAFAKWYSDPNGKVGPDFNYQDVRFIGGKPGTWSGAQLIPADFDGNGKVDVLAFLPDVDTSRLHNTAMSLFAKWYSDPNGIVGPDFTYHRVMHVGIIDPNGQPSLELSPTDIDGDGRTDFLVLFPGKDLMQWWLSWDDYYINEDPTLLDDFERFPYAQKIGGQWIWVG